MSEGKTVYIISGANRGIGRGLVTALLARPTTVVIAGSRDPTNDTTKSLKDLPKHATSTLITVKLDSSSKTDALDAVKLLQHNHGIKRIDVVISNAGMSPPSSKILASNIEDLDETVRVNVGGALRLFQAVNPLLDRSGAHGLPKLIAISAGLGSISLIDKIPMSFGLYSVSKAALNFAVRKVAFEEDGLIAMAIHPGHVDTAMGAVGAEMLGIERAETSVEESVEGMMKIIDGASKESNGRFFAHDGSEVPW